MILITAGQALAMILFFICKGSPNSKHRLHPVALGILFLCVHVMIQLSLNGSESTFSFHTVSIPLKFFITMCYYMFFIYLWTDASISVCVLMALLFEMIDNCLYPLLSILMMYLFPNTTAHLFRYFLFLCLFWLLECVLLYLIHRLLPSIKKIHIRRHNLILLFMSIFPFMYYRIFSTHFSVAYSQPTQIIMTLYSLIMVIVSVDNIGHTSVEFENQLSVKLQYALQLQKQQFQKKLQDADAVNQKYHDMKNILLYLERQQNTELAKQQIQKMMEELQPYETSVNTGNDAVDIVLNEKLSLCHQKQISCIPYVDGSLLNFIAPLDLCIIFGNALDNAVESCEKILSKEARHISVKTIQKGNTVLLVFRNTFACAPLLKDGFPATTKHHSSDHGYGLRNICNTAEKYHGNVTCHIEGEEFILSLLFVRE